MNKTSEKRVTLFVTPMSSFLTTFMSSSVNIALPSIGNEFAMDAVLLSWVNTALILASAIFLVPFGRLTDIYGRRRFCIYGISSFTGASLLVGLAKSPLILILGRILQGIGAAMIFGSSVALLISVFPAWERGKVLGINVTAIYLGLFLGPVLGGFLTQQFGWRSIFWANIPLGLMLLTLIFWKLKREWVEAKGEKFDLVGSILYGFMLLMLMYGFSLLPASSGIGFFLLGIVGVLIFVKWELTVDTPVLDLRLFRMNRVFAFSNLAAMINFSATHAVTFLLSLYLQYIKELSPQNAGLVLVAQPVVQATFSSFAGRLSDRVKPQNVASTGMALTVVGLLPFTNLSNTTSLGFIIASLALLGLGAAFFSSPNTNAVMGSVERKIYGVASGTRGTMRLIGQMLSMGITMLLFTLYMGRVQITPAFYSLFLGSVQTAFGIFAILCFCGIFASLVRDKKT